MMHTRLQMIPSSTRWFIAAGLFLFLFLLYTALFISGYLLAPTIAMEQWLLHRPLTRADCVLVQWRSFGEVPVSLLLTALLGILCICLKYRWWVLPCLLIVLFAGVGIEVVGKQVLPEPVPGKIYDGLGALSCPQLNDTSRMVQWEVLWGMWWKAPAPYQDDITTAHISATTPYSFEDAQDMNGFPSGHAIRWSFIGLVLCWLAWRHIRYRLLRILLMVVAFAIALGGGLFQVYIGVHLFTDLIAGYCIGASSACCAIGLLLLTQKQQYSQPLSEPTRVARNSEELSSRIV